VTASREAKPSKLVSSLAGISIAGVSDPGTLVSATGEAGLTEASYKGEAGASLLSTGRQLELMRALQRLSYERAKEEERIRTALVEGLRAAEEARNKAAAEIGAQFAKGREKAAAEYEKVTGDARRRYEDARNAAQKEYKGIRSGVESEVSRVTAAARSERQQASWETLTVFDALKGRPRERFQQTVKRLERINQEFAVLEHDAIAIMKMRRQWREFPAINSSAEPLERAGASPPPSDDAVDQAVQHAVDLANAVRDSATKLHGQTLSKLFEGGWPFGMFAFVWAIAAIPCGIWLGWNGWQWIAASCGIAIVASVGLLAWLAPVARRQSGRQFEQIQQLLADGRQALRTALEAARERGQRETQTLVSERDQTLTAVDKKLHAIVGERERWKEGEIGRAGQTFPQLLAQLRSELDETLHSAKQKHNAALALVTETRDRREVEHRAEFDRRSHELRAIHDRDWQSLAEMWREGLDDLHAAWNRMNDECARLFPDWESTDYDKWAKPDVPSPSIQFGEVSLDFAQVKHGISPDERLRPAETKMQLPALMTLDEHPVMLITAEEEGRREAIDVLQLVMLRMITAMPPGKVRFTVLDPVGLGENFASFMHLADFDEQLIASRIWTDARQIDEQLTRLTAHMETVLQKYLRNEFATIHEYNAQAGEVAEPFQVLVVANFPTNFSEAAARKLVSIATSGPRCGVYTLIMVDRKQKMPANFDLNDLAAGAVHLDWVTGVEQPHADFELPSAASPAAPLPKSGEGRFRWRYPAFEHLPLTLDQPPSAERFNEVLRAAGRTAKDSMRVEVPFEQVAPPEDEYWTGDCGKELVVPIGRAGARRLQPVRLGKGTSQHLLVCGKTGSGKSTFLHALITNAALIYGPDEVEFYLIDFKKGVEFKTYATHRLPHARVIAIESEREFGLSVLERLDNELRRRGDLFRAAGVQDLPDFRKHVAESLRDSKSAVSEKLPYVGPMPRVLLVVDEFQELFVEDDKLAQDANLLLDRLVRQGRAFGIHVLLGSQTLSGAFSLARSTMGQMAVRVALQCSETDANLILSDERNMAARFLNRPGEAIYNDQNGLLAGNHPFQVVWLPESQRIEYLRQIEERSEKRGVRREETIVFEGDQPAEPADNVQLREVLERGPSDSPSSPQKAWVGAAVAIKEPTSVTFARHAGSNLLVVGAWEESALGVLTNALVALAAQNPVGDMNSEQTQFFVLDGTRPESPEAGTWQRIADTLPHKIEVGGPRDTARIIGDIAAELIRRESAGDEDAPPIYLVIFNGGRFRDLRRGEDDFSFSSDRDKAPSPDKQWAEILRNGPAWGVHTLLWCDSYNNVTRMLDRVAMREFEMRIAFQMSAADSSSLLDNPAATRLRQHRGLFASEDLGTIEKFRPYGIPTEAWLDEVRCTIQGTTQPEIFRNGPRT
jgi:S-DNA-T family DNA segregation ATPase FtsK/SpoIIIE